VNDRFDYQRQINEEMEQMTVLALNEAQDKGVSEDALLILASMTGARWKPNDGPAH
jgi:hypothetical protein